MSNTGPKGDLDTDPFQRAILQHRNMPDPVTKVSPTMCVFGRPVKDFIPILPGKYEPHRSWTDMMSAREEALRARHLKETEKWSEHTKRLPPLVVGDQVRIQNQTGPNPTKWDRTGKVIEVRQFDQYDVRVDGTGRSTLRNRRFLRKFAPLHKTPPPRTIADDLKHIGTPFFTTPATSVIDPPTQASTEHTVTPSLPTAPSSPTDSRPPPPPPPSPSPPPIQEVQVETPPINKKPPFALRRLMAHNNRGLKD